MKTLEYKKINQAIISSKEKCNRSTMKKCVFFDRDNTLIIDSGYTYKTSDLIWKTGAIKAMLLPKEIDGEMTQGIKDLLEFFENQYVDSSIGKTLH